MNMNILEVLTTVLLMCSSPDVGCKVIDNEETLSTRIEVCLNTPTHLLPPTLSLGLINMNDVEKYRYITVQPISCLEV